METTRNLKGAVGATVTGVALAACPAGALASLSTPTKVSPANMAVQQTDVATGGGRTVIAMAGSDLSGRHARLIARLGGTNGGALQQLSSGSATDPQVAVGADGTAVAAWVTTHGETATLHAALARPGDPFGVAQTLAQATQIAPAIALGGVAVTPSGRAVVAWRPNLSPAGTLVTSGTPVRVAIAPAGGTFGAAQTLGDSLYGAPDIGTAPDGSVVVAWKHVPDAPLPPPAPPVTGTWATFAALLPAAGPVFGAPMQLDTPTDTAGRPDVASGPGGLVVTSHHERTDRRLSRLLAGGTFSAGTPLPATHGSRLSDVVSAGVPAIGDTVAVWSETRNTSPESDTLKYAVVNASTQHAAGAFSAAQRLSGAGWLAGVPSAAALRDQAIAAWAEERGARSRVVIGIHKATSASWQIQPVVSQPRISTYLVGLAAGSTSATLTWSVTIPGHPSHGGAVYRTTYRP